MIVQISLKNEYGLSRRTITDIRNLVERRFSTRPAGWLKDVALEIGLNTKKPRHVTNSNWEARVLSEEQVEHARIDAYASYRVGNELVK